GCGPSGGHGDDVGPAQPGGRLVGQIVLEGGQVRRELDSVRSREEHRREDEGVRGEEPVLLGWAGVLENGGVSVGGKQCPQTGTGTGAESYYLGVLCLRGTPPSSEHVRIAPAGTQ